LVPSVPSVSLPALELTGFLDASHATCCPHTCCSVTGFCLCLAGAAVADKIKVQPTVATSSTEAELMAAADATDVTKWLSLHTVLHELGFSPTGPSILHEDNQTAINMINTSHPAKHARHIDIQHFAMQVWRQLGNVIMQRIPGIVVNPADQQLTKNLGWIPLHTATMPVAGSSMDHCSLVWSLPIFLFSSFICPSVFSQ
jgi:hypothetical protein